MELEKLKLEKDKIINLQNDYFEKILDELTLYKQQMNVYKEKLEKAQNTINELNIELKLSQEEIINRKIEINKLRSELIKAEDEIYNLTQNNPYSKLELIKDLKEVYIKANDDDSEEILDEILDGIDIIEEKISYTDMIFIMYLCYIYDRLQVLLSTSIMANNYYSNHSKEAKLLKIVSQEENSNLYNNVEECTQSYIEKHSDLFKDLDIKIKERIIETLYEMSYKYFNSVECENNIDKDDNVVTIKCWVRGKQSLDWKLVTATYSDRQSKIYMPQNMIDILNLTQKHSIDNKNIINDHFQKIKNIFLNEDSDKLKKLMRATREKKDGGIFNDIINLNVSEETIDLNKAYTLLLISIFYHRYEKLLYSSKYLRDLIQSNCIESKLILVLREEIMLSPGGIIDLPIRLFIDKYTDEIKYIDNDVKNKVIELANNIFYKECDNVLSYEKLNGMCYYDNYDLKMDTRYIKLFDGYESKYMLFNSHVCFKCNSIYIKQKTIRKIEGKLDGFEIIVKPKITEKSTNINKVDKLREKEKAINLYNTIINKYRINNISEALIVYNNIIENKELIKYYNKNQKITLLFIGYLIKGNTYGAKEILEAGDIGVSVDTILYKRLYNGLGFKSYLNEYKTSIAFIDLNVREKILYNIKQLSNDKEGKLKLLSSNQVDIDSNKLNAESEIKKMGYSTSLTREERWNILKNKAIPRLGKYKVMGHISFLIKMNKGRDIMANAVNEWTYDLERLRNLG